MRALYVRIIFTPFFGFIFTPYFSNEYLAMLAAAPPPSRFIRKLKQQTSYPVASKELNKDDTELAIRTIRESPKHTLQSNSNYRASYNRRIAESLLDEHASSGKLIKQLIMKIVIVQTVDHENSHSASHLKVR